MFRATAAADVAMAADRSTSSELSLFSNCSLPLGRSRRSISVGDMIRSSYFALFPDLFIHHSLTTTFDRYCGLIPSRSPKLRGPDSLSPKGSCFGGDLHVTRKISSQPIPLQPVEPTLASV